MEDTFECMGFEICTLGRNGSKVTNYMSVQPCSKEKGGLSIRTELNSEKELVLASPEGY